MKKLLFLINSLNVGGAEKALITLVNNLDKSKFKVTVLSILDGGACREDLDKDIEYRTIIKTKNKFLRKLFARLICFTLPAKFVYKKFIKKKYYYDYEAAYLEGVPTKLLSVSNAPCKYAWVQTDFSKYYSQEKVYKKISDARNCYSKFDKIIFASLNAQKGFIEKLGAVNEANYLVIYNYLNKEKIVEKSNEKINEDLSKDRKIVLSVGRLVEQKAYDRLLKVHKKLISENVLHYLWIAGDGPKREELENYIKENNLQNSVKLLGYQENPYKFMKNADIFASSSVVEGFSLVSIEAMFCGSAIMLTDVGGAREALGDSEYGIVAESSEEGIYEGLKTLLLDEEKIKYFKKQSEIRSEYIAEKFSIKNVEKIFEG